MYLPQKVEHNEIRIPIGLSTGNSDHEPIAIVIEIGNLLHHSPNSIPLTQRKNCRCNARANEISKHEIPNVLETVWQSKTPTLVERMYDKCKCILLKAWESARYKVLGRFKRFWNRTMDRLSKKRKTCTRRPKDQEIKENRKSTKKQEKK